METHSQEQSDFYCRYRMLSAGRDRDLGEGGIRERDKDSKTETGRDRDKKIQRQRDTET
jgi:hypothetical protein